MDYSLLTITAHIATPIVSDRHLPIDGILLSLACEREYGALDSQKPAVLADFDPAVCPIRKIMWSHKWFYQASFVLWGNVAKSQNFFTRRHNETEAEVLSNGKQWDSGRGEYRNIYHKFEQSHSPFVTWHVVGDKDTIVNLLSSCDAIGKYRHKGHGAISQWDVTEADGDIDKFGVVNDGGKPLRAIPLEYASHIRLPMPMTTRIGRVAYRPPYWSIENYEDCYLP